MTHRGLHPHFCGTYPGLLFSPMIPGIASGRKVRFLSDSNTPPTAPKATPGSTFAELGLDARLVEALTASGYAEPTPIQRDSIPVLLEGKDLIGLAKRKPGALNYGSAGTGSPGHLAGELFKLRTGSDIVHVQCVSNNGLYGLIAARLLRLPLVVSMQGELTMDATGVYQRSRFLPKLL